MTFLPRPFYSLPYSPTRIIFGKILILLFILQIFPLISFSLCLDFCIFGLGCHISQHLGCNCGDSSISLPSLAIDWIYGHLWVKIICCSCCFIGGFCRNRRRIYSSRNVWLSYCYRRQEPTSKNCFNAHVYARYSWSFINILGCLYAFAV